MSLGAHTYAFLLSVADLGTELLYLRVGVYAGLYQKTAFPKVSLPIYSPPEI